MKRLLVPLLAALALPTAVNAEEYYFLGQHGSGFYTVPMASKKLCEEAGSKFIIH